MLEVWIRENQMEIPKQELITSQETIRRTNKPRLVARQLRMDNRQEEETTTNELELAGRDMPNLLEWNLNENTNTYTALKLELEGITPTRQADANLNPLPALTPLRAHGAPLQDQNTSLRTTGNEASQDSRRPRPQDRNASRDKGKKGTIRTTKP